MPTDTTASSTASSKKSTSWLRGLIVTSPHPSRLPGGMQLERAPMCPCLACWESGSPYHVSRPPSSASASASVSERDNTGNNNSAASATRKTPLSLFRKNQSNNNRESVASDWQPLQPSTTVASSVAPSVTSSAASVLDTSDSASLRTLY